MNRQDKWDILRALPAEVDFEVWSALVKALDSKVTDFTPLTYANWAHKREAKRTIKRLREKEDV